jgi:hypothetical protein
MYPVSCTQYPVSSILYPVSRIQYPVSSSIPYQYPVLCILYPVASILYHVPSILYPVSCILYHVPCIMYPVSSIMHLVSCTQYLVCIYVWSQFFTDWFLLKKFKPSYMNWTQKTMNEKLNFNVFFFKNGFFFENCADCTDFLKKCTDL